MRAVHAKDVVLLLLSSFQVSKLRSLTLEDNFNNTFCSKCPSKHFIAWNCYKFSKKMWDCVIFHIIFVIKCTLIVYASFSPTFWIISVRGIDRTIIIQKVGRRQNLNMVYKIISGQKMSPSHNSKTQHIISLQYLLLP